jgi:hypothetical protein
VWIAQSQDWARNPQRNLSFNGRVLRSYSTDIANITDYTVQDGRRVVLMDSYNYSQTTNRHLREAKSAVDSNRYCLLRVPIINPKCDSDHKRNAESLYDHYHESIAYVRTPRARLWASQSQTTEERIADKMEEYQHRLDKYNTYNKYVWKRRLPLFTVPEYIKECVGIAIERNVKYYAEAEARYARQRAQAMVKEREKLVRWLEGDNVYVMGHLVDGVYLRLTQRESGNVVQTTMGAEVPEGHAQRIWAFIQMLRAKGETYEHNGHTQHIGQFRVDSIDKDYTLRAGCHTITYERMAAFAQKVWGE